MLKEITKIHESKDPNYVKQLDDQATFKIKLPDDGQAA